MIEKRSELTSCVGSTIVQKTPGNWIHITTSGETMKILPARAREVLQCLQEIIKHIDGELSK